MNETLMNALEERLEAAELHDDANLLVMLAMQGSEALDAFLASGPTPNLPTSTDTSPSPPARAYLRSITVQGFRGIGPEATLPVDPGPGLTLVVGRNGSGKSSFAEALEVLLTGDNKRWSGRRAKVWSEGWRNLHHRTGARVQAELVVEGESAPATVVRTWGDDSNLDDSRSYLQLHGKPKAAVDAFGWGDALVTFRPFLSYNELGSMLDDGPSRLFDALAGILGLDELVEAEAALRRARLSRDKFVKAAKQRRDDLLARLEFVDDDRATAAHAALKAKPWVLDALEPLITGAGDGRVDVVIGILRALSILAPPPAEDAAAAVGSLRQAKAALEEVAGTEAERELRLAELLERALTLHREHGDEECPVCGSGRLDAEWQARAASESARLRGAAARATEANRQMTAAIASARRLLVHPPEALLQAGQAGVEAGEALAAWKTWSAGPQSTDVEALAAHIETAGASLADSLAALRADAAEELERREDAWRPVAVELAAWLEVANAAARADEIIPSIKAAERWIKEWAADMRAERFAPIASDARRLWSMLRTHSNVDLEEIALVGTSTQRRVELKVNVDGVEGAALGVMSQGELHALALSLFLPRATLPESPFRFLVIDDPVQSMDPARVDGLARVLESTAHHRQVLVFTHDDRLPEAVRRLGVRAKIIEVTRREASVVHLVATRDPVMRYLDEARAVAKSEDLPAKVGTRVVPGLCRLAVEAACLEVLRRRRLGRGDPHSEVEKVWDAAQRTTARMSLALFDDATRGGEVMGAINKRFGSKEADAFRAVKAGAHGSYGGDIEDLAKWTEWLVTKIRGLT